MTFEDLTLADLQEMGRALMAGQFTLSSEDRMELVHELMERERLVGYLDWSFIQPSCFWHPDDQETELP